jgi:hypothetical protein
MKHGFLSCILVALTGCAPADDEPSSLSAGDPPTSGGTAGDVPKTIIHASFVAEQKAGDGPALLRMFNDTNDQILSLTLEDGQPFTFYLVEPRTATDYEITVSDDMSEEAILSIHTLDTCVRKPFAEMTGPLALEPGHAYAIHVSVEDGFRARIEEEPLREPYIGVRAHVTDSAQSVIPAPSKLVLSTGAAPPGEVVFDTIFTEYSESYVRVTGPSVTLEKVRFVDRSGAAHESTSPVVLERRHGYTVYVADEARDGAEVDVLLED